MDGLPAAGVDDSGGATYHGAAIGADLGIGVTVARLALNQLVQVQILDPQFFEPVQRFEVDDGRPGIGPPIFVGVPSGSLGIRLIFGESDNFYRRGVNPSDKLGV